MKLALTCSKFKVRGGRERDCMDIAEALATLGHSVTVLTTQLPNAADLDRLRPKVRFQVLPARGWFNHSEIAHFCRSVASWRQENPVDAVIGFDKMPGLDICYLVDPPWQRHIGAKALLPRHRTYIEMERAVFTGAAPPYVFFLAPQQADEYRRYYSVSDELSVVLPPTLRTDRRAPETFYASRDAVRRELGIPDDCPLLVHVAIYGTQKGTDRVIKAIADVPDAVLACVGLKDAGKWLSVARHHHAADRVHILGYHENLGRIIGASDLMVHPARIETAGNVIIESLLNGVPVIASAVCGYADQIVRSGAGRVIHAPHRSKEISSAIQECMQPETLATLKDRARAFSAVLATSPGTEAVAQRISETLEQRGRAGQASRVRARRMHNLISVVVSTYNREDALNAVLCALADQDDPAFEVIVADDGSAEPTATLIRSHLRNFPVDLRHVWQRDDGFRAAAARNRGIAAARGDYVVFLDGDCVPHRGFVAGHRRISERGWFVAGSRVLLDPEMTRRVLASGHAPAVDGLLAQIDLRRRGHINRLILPARTPLGRARRLRSTKWETVRSANLAIWRDDLERIDGFDERYCGWGLEDSDLALRLIRAGLRRKDGMCATTVFHLWHSQEARSAYAANARMLEETLASGRTTAIQGISQLDLEQPATTAPEGR